MPNLNIIRSSISKLPDGPPIVAVLAGGTTGIGSYIAKALARTFSKHGPNLRVYIVGRNATRAEDVIRQCREISPGSEWQFVKSTDLALISEVDRCCAEIIRRESEAPFRDGPVRVDLLYMTHCYPILKERTTTSEGLDAFISTTYYSRMRMILLLLPLLEASPITGHAISVYAGAVDISAAPGELRIGCPPDAVYSLHTVRKYTTFMKTFFFETLAEKYAGKLSLVHIYPGLVEGPGFQSPDMPLWFRVFWQLILKPLTWWYQTTPDDCGDVMLYLATERYPAKGINGSGGERTMGGVGVAKSTRDEIGGGAYSVGQRGDEQKGVAFEEVRKDDTEKLVWEHTMETFARIEAGWT